MMSSIFLSGVYVEWFGVILFFQWMVRASVLWFISCVNCVCRSLSFFFSMDRPVITIFSGFSDPVLSTLKKNLLALPPSW